MELLERHFDTAFDAPDGIKKLRELILTLAMQGKLVPQDSNDSPASELLKEIEAEKKRLVKQGKIKEPKQFSPVASEEVPYSLPKGWMWAKLRQICHDWGQQTPTTRFTYIDVGSIDNNRGTISTDTQILESSEAPSRARKIVRKGTVIYSTVRPYLLNAAVVDKDFTPSAIVSTAFAILHPYSGVDGRYIYFFLRSPFFVRYVEANQKGVAYPAINDGDLFAGDFPLPPAAEQRRIVAKIDELMARCDALEKLRAERDAKRLAAHTAALRQLLNVADTDGHIQAREFLGQHFGELYTVREHVSDLRKAILQLAVMGKLVPQDPNDPPASELLKQIESETKRLVKEGKLREPKPLPPVSPEDVPYSLPNGWQWVRLGTVGSTNIGLTYSPTDVSDSGIPVLRSNSIQNGMLDLSDLKRVAVEVKESVLVEEGDLLICARNGSRALVGKTAMIPALPEKMAFGAFMAIFRSRINPFLLRFINSPLFREMIDEVNTVTINQITQENLRETAFPLPPLPEQHRIVAKIDLLMSMCDTLEQQIDAARKTQSAMLNAMMAQYGGHRCA
jgi:type I restriction enzyme, S subunit